MKIIILLLSFTLLLSSEIKELKIASYNVENLFDDINDGSEYKDFRPNKWGKKEYQEKLNAIAKVIDELNADIIALQEIENKKVLQELSKKTNYKFQIFSTTQNAPVGIAILSKIEPKNIKEHKIAQHKTRNIISADFEIQDVKFTIFALHFPAYNNAKGLPAQKAAARKLKNIIKDTKNVIILGDFNQNYTKNSKNFLNGELHKYFKNGYINLWDEVNPKNRYSHLVGTKRAIDHIILSPDFFKINNEIRYKRGSFKAEKYDFLLDYPACKNQNNILRKMCQTIADPKQIEPAKNSKKTNIYSDHLPITAIMWIGK